MPTVLLTGANGFIGCHCIEPLLDRGYDVHGVTRYGHQDSAHEDVTWHSADLLNSEERAGLIDEVRPTHLLHLAWCTTPGEYLSSRENLEWVQASLDLFEIFADRGGQRAVMVGTCLEYDNRHGYFSEDVTPLRPTTLYGTCKNAVRAIGQQFSNDEALTFAWPRVFLLYGPRERRGRLVSSVVTSLLRDEPAECSHGGQVRDFLYVQDVADALCSLVDSELRGPINVASGKPVTVRDVVGEIADQLDRRHLVEFGALEPRPDDPPMIVGDVTRLREELGWIHERSLAEGISETIKWWRTELQREA